MKRSEPIGGRRETAESLREREYQLHAIIEELEEVISSRILEEERGAAMTRRNILPAPEYRNRSLSREKWQNRSRSRIRSRKRNADGIRFLILLAIACALFFWLIKWG